MLVTQSQQRERKSDVNTKSYHLKEKSKKITKIFRLKTWRAISSNGRSSTAMFITHFNIAMLRWFGFRHEPIFETSSAALKMVAHIKSGQKWNKNNSLSTFAIQSKFLIHYVEFESSSLTANQIHPCSGVGLGNLW